MMKIDLTQTHDVIGTYQSLDWSDIRSKYTDEGTTYAFDVLDEKVISGYLIKLASFRHLRDLQREEYALWLHDQGFFAVFLGGCWRMSST